MKTSRIIKLFTLQNVLCVILLFTFMLQEMPRKLQFCTKFTEANLLKKATNKQLVAMPFMKKTLLLQIVQLLLIVTLHYLSNHLEQLFLRTFRMHICEIPLIPHERSY